MTKPIHTGEYHGTCSAVVGDVTHLLLGSTGQ